MYTFETPLYLWFLGLLPLLVMAMRWYEKKQESRRTQWIETPLLQAMLPQMRFYHSWPSILFYLLAAASFIIAAANPQRSQGSGELPVSSSDIVIALDLSNSMYANDESPSRWMRGRLLAEEIVAQLAGDRVAFICFAGEAYLMSPFTTDYGAVTQLIRATSPATVGIQGTDMGKLLQMYQKMAAAQDSTKGALVVLTDGEDHESNALELAKTIAKQGGAIFTIALGTEKGDTFSLPEKGLKKDAEGNPILSKVNLPYLQDLAKAGQGVFYESSNLRKDIRPLITDLDRIEKRPQGKANFQIFYSFGPWIAGFGAILLLFAWMLPQILRKFQNA